MEGNRRGHRDCRDRHLRRGHPRLHLRSDGDGLAPLAVLGLVLLPIGVVVALLAGTPLDAFTLWVATALFLSLTVALAFTHRGALLPMAYVLLFWFGVVGGHMII